MNSPQNNPTGSNPQQTTTSRTTTPPGTRGQVWGRLMGSAWRHPKYLGLDADPVALSTMALSWSMDNKTDGFIPAKAIAQILPALTSARATRATRALVERRLWERVPGGFMIHDWTDYNPTVKDMEEERQNKSRSGALGAAARWQSDGTRHSDRHSTRHSDGNGKPMQEVEVDESKPKPTTPCPETGPSDDLDDLLRQERQQRFDAWWSAFPKRASVGSGTKGDAWTVWCAMDPTPDDRQLNFMLEVLREQEAEDWPDWYDKADGSVLITPAIWLSMWCEGQI